MKFNNISVLYLKGDDYDQDFINHACCITHLFLRLLGNYEVGEHRIMAITLVPPSLQEIRGYILKRDEFINADGVLKYYMSFDIEVFRNYTIEEKKQCLWNIIFKIMTKAAIEFGWDQSHLQTTYDVGIAENLKNEFYFKNYKTSPDRKLKAIVRIDFQIKTCLVYADFYTRDGAFLRSELFLDWEPFVAFENLFALKNASWEKDQFILHLKDGERYNATMPINNVIWSFEDEYGEVVIRNEQLFPWMLLQERLMKEVYKGSRIRAIHLNFISEERYLQKPEVLRYHVNSHIGKLSYNEVFDLDAFEKMPREGRPAFMWNKAFEVLKLLAKETDNPLLLEAAEYAWRKGLDTGLNPDYRLLEKEVELHGETCLAVIWMIFSADRMTAVFKLERNGKVLLEKSISSTILGVGYLLWAFESIEAARDTIIIKGSKNMGELPMKLPVSAEMIAL